MNGLRLLILGRYASVVGDELLPIALALAVASSGGTAGDVGLVLGAGLVPVLLLLPFTGALADRVDRRVLVVAADGVRGALLIGIGIVIVFSRSGPNLGMLVGLQVVAGTAEAVYRPAAAALIPQVLPPDSLKRGNALLGIGTNIGEIIGPALAGVLIATAGLGWALVFDGFTFLVSVLTVSQLRILSETPPGAESTRRSWSKGYVLIRTTPWLRRLLFTEAVWLFAGTAPILVLGPVVARELGGTERWGFVMAAYGVGGVAGGLVALRASVDRPLRLIGLTFALEALVPLALVGRFPLVAIATAAILGGTVSGMGAALKPTLIQQRIDVDSLGRISAVEGLLGGVMLPMGLVVAGTAAEAVGTTPVLLCASIAAVASALLLLVSNETRNITITT